MATVVSSESKKSFRYVSTVSGDNTTRTISGLNFGHEANIGPVTNTALTFLIDTLNGLTTSNLSGFRLITEQEVRL